MPSISQFLISRLKSNGVKHVFGVPGDYVLKLYSALSKEVTLIGTTDEQCAGFAADAYARVNGIGCVCATYSVGGFKLINSIGGAYAEKSPVVVICGSPGKKERLQKYALHHAVGSYDCQHEMFKRITCATCVLDNPAMAGYEIDRVLMDLSRYKQPVYIEMPRDMVDVSLSYDPYLIGTPQPDQSNKDNLFEAVSEVVKWIEQSSNPVILAGIELARFGFGEIITRFSKKYNIPIATTILAKSLTDELSPLSLGVYCGDATKDSTKNIVESSDCIIMLGVMVTDVNFGFKPMIFNKSNTVFCTTNQCTVKNHSYDDVIFSDFVNALVNTKIIRNDKRVFKKEEKDNTFTPTAAAITVKRLFDKINTVLNENMAVIADVGDSLFGASELLVRHSNQFLAQAFYTSMGFAVPAALGVQVAKPDIRSIVVVGDGAFQMTGVELSTIIKNKLNPIIIVLNNYGYTTERFLLDGDFNNIQNWEYHKIVDMIGGGIGFIARNEVELNDSLDKAVFSKEMCVINVILDKKDKSMVLERMTSKLKKVM